MTTPIPSNFHGVDKAKIQNLINSGIDVMREVATLKEGLKDTVTAISEELDIEKKVLNRAIRLAYKKSIQNQNVIEDAQEELDAVEQLLAAAGV
jgi:phage host-nuclease inhibitor protein Gam